MMNNPQLDIRQKSGKIGINIKNPEMNIQQKKSQMEIQQKPGKLDIKKDIVEINVDNYPARFDLGYRNIEDSLKKIKNEGQKTALEAIKEYAQTGDKLMDFQNVKISEISYNKAFKDGNKEIRLRFKRGPKIEVQPNKLNMKYKLQFPVISSKINKPRIQANLGEVKMWLEQKPEIEIEVIGNNINRKV